MIQTVFPGNFGLEGGHAQCHEHIWLNKGASYNVNKALCEDSPEKSLKELKTYYSAGGRLIHRMWTSLGETDVPKINARRPLHKVMAAGRFAPQGVDQPRSTP